MFDVMFNLFLSFVFAPLSAGKGCRAGIVGISNALFQLWVHHTYFNQQGTIEGRRSARNESVSSLNRASFLLKLIKTRRTGRFDEGQ
jgi:hypothetical protein